MSRFHYPTKNIHDVWNLLSKWGQDYKNSGNLITNGFPQTKEDSNSPSFLLQALWRGILQRRLFNKQMREKKSLQAQKVSTKRLRSIEYYKLHTKKIIKIQKFWYNKNSLFSVDKYLSQNNWISGVRTITRSNLKSLRSTQLLKLRFQL